MANVIQIKRSATTATPASLAEGEMAYSENSDNLFIGTNGGANVTKIGGQTDVAKLAGISAGADVSPVTSVSGKTGVVTLAKADVALGSVDNTSDATKDAATATLTNKTLTSPAINTPTGIVKGDVGLGSVDNTADTAKPVSTAQQTAIDLKLNLTGGTLSGGDLTLWRDPINALDAATKQYVDAVSTGLDVKASVRAGTTANITLSGAQTIDGVSVVAGDRVLVKNQSIASENGIYDADAGAWTRSSDTDTAAEVTSGMFTFIEEGTALSSSGWVLQTTGSISLGSTALTFGQFTGGASYSAGTGIDLSGSVFSLIAHSAALVTSGTMDAGRIAGGILGASSGVNLTALNASNISSGTIADARLSSLVLLSTSGIDGGTF